MPQLLRRVEKEEERLAFQDDSKQRIHTVILNLVIGTLYSTPKINTDLLH